MASTLLRNFKFKVTIAGMAPVGFSKVSGLSQTVEVIEYREGGDPITTKKFPGQVSFDNVTLERGVTEDSDLMDWINSLYNPSLGSVQEPRKDVTITVMDKNNVAQREYVLTNAFPASRTLNDLDATSNEILIESLELAHEGIVETRFVNGTRSN